MQMQTFSLTEVFGIPGADDVMVDIMPKTAHSLSTTKGYLFRKEPLKTLMQFFLLPTGGDGLFVFGPYGSGKTSLVTEYVGRMNYPTVVFDWNYESEVEDLVGRTGIEFGDTAFQYGPLATAMREGYCLLINEIDRGRASNLTLLHGILDGKSLHIKETGEVIEPHPNFRLVVTANSAGSGDLSGTYTGSVRQLDPAFLDRFIFLEMDYLQPHEEIDMLSIQFPSFEMGFIERIVQFANETRKAADDVAETFTTSLSTRGIKRFLKLAMGYGLDQNQSSFEDVLPAITPSYLARLSPEDREVAEVMLRSVLPSGA